jgi:hypothetical protein
VAGLSTFSFRGSTKLASLFRAFPTALFERRVAERKAQCIVAAGAANNVEFSKTSSTPPYPASASGFLVVLSLLFQADAFALSVFALRFLRRYDG